ncbi:MAG: flagellin [Gammaproteobacteria bacterium]|nr:flagellin [Gammaproteobacteria bacterium]
MALVINTNMLSLNAQTNLGKTQNSLATAMQRLSSGLRINSAADDPAGLAIANLLTTQVNGLNQALQNVSNATSLSQTADGALTQITNALQTVRQLAVQAADASNSPSDRAALNQEVQQQIAEINQIATQTSFNGQNLLDGSFGNAQFQVGANAGQTINLNLSTGVRTDQIGQIADATGSAVSTTALGGTETIQVGSNPAVTIAASLAGPAGAAAGETAYSAFAKATAINNSGVSGLTATASTSETTAFTTTSGNSGNTYSLTINGQTVYSNYDLYGNGPLTGSDVANQINTYSNSTGVTASFNSATGQMTLSAADGRDIIASQTLGGGASGGAANLASLAGGTSAPNNWASAFTQVTGLGTNDYYVTVNGTNVAVTPTSGSVSGSAVAAAINANATLSAAGVTASYSATTGDLTLSSKSGAAITAAQGMPSAASGGDSSFSPIVQSSPFTTVTGLTATDSYTVGKVNGQAITLAADASGQITASELVTAINGTTGVNAVASVDASGNVVLTSTNGQAITASFGSSSATGTYVANEIYNNTTSAVTTTTGMGASGWVNTAVNTGGSTEVGGDVTGTLSLSASSNIVITGQAADLGFGGASGTASNSTIAQDSTTLSNVNVLTVAGANDAIKRVDSALQSVDSLQATFGAIQNRFQLISANLQTAVDNQTAARSAVQDANFAAETANLTRAEVLQQAGIAMLAQANAQPQQILALLK